MAKGKASNMSAKIKWLLAMGIFSMSVIGNGYFTEFAFLYRVLAVVVLFVVTLYILGNTVVRTGEVKLMHETKTEMRRVVRITRIKKTQTFKVIFG